MRTLLSAFILLCLSSFHAAAQTPSISMTTAKASGTSISFYLSCASATTVQIDFGDGVLISKPISTGQTSVSGTVQASQTIKVYGADIDQLVCFMCELTALDVSQCPSLTDLNCSINELTALDVRNNVLLANLYFTNNKLSTIDLSQNVELERFSCSNNQLTSLDVSANAKLSTLDCIWMTGITWLDLSNNPLLTSLDCRLCSITSLNVTKCPLLATLYCFNNKLVSLDISGNPELTTLNCTDNLLESLDVSNNLKLSVLNVQRNKIPTLDISRNTALTQFFCQTNLLTSADVSNNPLLIYFFCSSNKISSIDITKNPLLLEVEFGNNLISAVDFSKNTALKSINVSKNLLTSLNVDANTELLSLDCSSNKIKSISTAMNTKLTKLYVNNNMLTQLNVGSNPKLYTLQCYSNYLRFSTLPVPTAALTSYYYAPQLKMPVTQLIYTGEEFDYVTDENSISNILSTFVWKTKTGAVLTEGTDYSIANGLTVFLRPQTDSVYCELTNSMFPNFPAYNMLRTTNVAVQADPSIIYTQNVELVQGWNLVSINVVPADASVAQIFAQLDVLEVKTEDAFWRRSQPDALNLLQTIQPGAGYLVYMNSRGTMTVSGTAVLNYPVPAATKQWRLIGCPYQMAKPFSTIFTYSNCSSVKNFAGFWRPSGSGNSFSDIEPGKAYFVKK